MDGALAQTTRPSIQAVSGRLWQTYGKPATYAFSRRARSAFSGSFARAASTSAWHGRPYFAQWQRSLLPRRLRFTSARRPCCASSPSHRAKARTQRSCSIARKALRTFCGRIAKLPYFADPKAELRPTYTSPRTLGFAAVPTKWRHLGEGVLSGFWKSDPADEINLLDSTGSRIRCGYVAFFAENPSRMIERL